MKSFEITRHAAIRMQQHSISMSDVELIMWHGEEIDDQGILFDNKATDAAIRSPKARIATLERLRNTKVMVDEGSVVTCCYPCGPKEARRIKKQARHS